MLFVVVVVAERIESNAASNEDDDRTSPSADSVARRSVVSIACARIQQFSLNSLSLLAHAIVCSAPQFDAAARLDKLRLIDDRTMLHFRLCYRVLFVVDTHTLTTAAVAFLAASGRRGTHAVDILDVDGIDNSNDHHVVDDHDIVDIDVDLATDHDDRLSDK